MHYDFDTCPDRRSTESVKWHQYQPDVLPLWVADMDFVSPEPVIEALRRRVEHGVFGYPQEPPELREVIVARLAERYNWQIHPDDIVFMPGVIRGFNLAAHAVAEPDAGILFQTPAYPPILDVPQNTGMLRQEMALTRNVGDAYSIDWDVFEASVTGQTRLFILCNPHNPVGRVFRQDELTRMAELCLRHGVVICSDEIHCDLVYSGHQHLPIASISPEIAQNTITLMAPSKTFNIAGLDCSFAVIRNEALRKRYQQVHHGLVSGVNALGWVAALAAYRDGQEWLTQTLAYLEGNRDYLCEFAQREIPDIEVIKPEGTYLAWLDCRGVGLDNPYAFFLQQAKVALNAGDMFGRGGQGYARLNFGCPRAMLTEALERLRDALQSRHNTSSSYSAVSG
ncbi:MAG: PatB family C-S lyase [Anaerolineae bacterium]|nr:PatB family C-S lyase [Anaerolineae bacterium]